MTSIITRLHAAQEFVAPFKGSPPPDTCDGLTILRHRLRRSAVSVVSFPFVVAPLLLTGLVIITRGNLLTTREREGAYMLVLAASALMFPVWAIWSEMSTSRLQYVIEEFQESLSKHPGAKDINPQVRAGSIAILLEYWSRSEWRLFPKIYRPIIEYMRDLLLAVQLSDEVRLTMRQREALHNMLLMPSSKEQLFAWQNRKSAREVLLPAAVRALGVLGQADTIPRLRSFIAYSQDAELRDAAARSIAQLESRPAAASGELLRAVNAPDGSDALLRAPAETVHVADEQLLRVSDFKDSPPCNTKS